MPGESFIEEDANMEQLRKLAEKAGPDAAKYLIDAADLWENDPKVREAEKHLPHKF